MYLTYREFCQVVLYSYDRDFYLIFRTKSPSWSIKPGNHCKSDREDPSKVMIRTTACAAMDKFYGIAIAKVNIEIHISPSAKFFQQGLIVFISLLTY